MEFLVRPPSRGAVQSSTAHGKSRCAMVIGEKPNPPKASAAASGGRSLATLGQGLDADDESAWALGRSGDDHREG